jgi:putative glutamine amidotransferase
MTGSPVVAVTATSDASVGTRRVRLNEAYTRALVDAGLTPVIVPPLTGPAQLDRILDMVDGLVLTGGEDVAPHRFGAAPHPATNPPNDARDLCELHLAAAARRRRLPTLAICRGIQVVNVALGGTLIQDIPSERPGSALHDAEEQRDTRVHGVDLDPSSRLAGILGTATPTTNSFHHQAVDRPADDVRITGHAADGIVEALESADPEWWMVAVQWHPEELTATPEDWDRRLFAAFAQAVRSRRS